MIRMIAAVSQNGVIGLSKENKLPFDYPADLKHFRTATMNSIIIMGRKTFESIGRALPKRQNIVISSQYLNKPGIQSFTSLSQALEEYDQPIPAVACDVLIPEEKDIWLIGGASIYQEGLKYAQEIWLTLTPDFIEGNNVVRFPFINPLLWGIDSVENLVPKDTTLKLVKYKRM